MKINQQRATELKKKIEFYRSRKENNIFDSFYHADLDVFVALIDANTLTPEEEKALEDEKKRLREEEEELARKRNAELVSEALSKPQSQPLSAPPLPSASPSSDGETIF